MSEDPTIILSPFSDSEKALAKSCRSIYQPWTCLSWYCNLLNVSILEELFTINTSFKLNIIYLLRQDHHHILANNATLHLLKYVRSSGGYLVFSNVNIKHSIVGRNNFIPWMKQNIILRILLAHILLFISITLSIATPRTVKMLQASCACQWLKITFSIILPQVVKLNTKWY